MNITDTRISEQDWKQFIKYIDIKDLLNTQIKIGVSTIIFKLNRRDTTFKDIIQIVKSYHEEFIKDGEMQDLYLCRDELSTVAPIFFQEFAVSVGIELDSYLEQSCCGAYHYCMRFINELYEKMNKDRLFKKKLYLFKK